MVDEKPSDTVKQQPVAQTANVLPPVNNPPDPDTQQVHTQPEQNRITNIEVRLRAGEIFMIWLTAAIAFFALCSVGVGLLQYFGGSRQTQKLIDAANQQVTAAQGFATTAGNIHTDLSSAISAAQTELGDNKSAIQNALADNRNELDNVLAQNRQSLQGAANAAVAQEKASNQQSAAALNATIVDAQLDQRAWIGVLGMDGKIGGPPVSGPQIEIVLKNTGKTPAVAMEGEMSFSIIPWTAPIPDFDTLENPQIIIQKGEVLAPEAMRQVWLLPPNLIGMPNPADNTRVHPILYVLGRFTYSDIFSGTPRRVTEICVMWRDFRDSPQICPTSNSMN
jgi:hypothetical protein